VATHGSLLVDARGNPRAGVILGLVAGALVLLSVGSFAALVFAGAGSPETLAIWVLAALVVVKVPLLILVWWLLGLKREQARSGGWSSAECAEILEYLEQQAQGSVGKPDAAARLAYFSREAWFVADAAADADKPAAVAAALRIDGLAQAARAGDGRGPAPRDAGPSAGA
jgi:hypothetical protein